MLSNKPYLVRAFYEWIVDSNCTPFLVANANDSRCEVPQSYIENGEITLNISPTAIRDLKISNESVKFRASFSGVIHIISVPIKAVLAVYAQENQQGMFFDLEEIGAEEEGDGTIETDNLRAPMTSKDQQESLSNKTKNNKPHLTLVE